MEIETEGMVSGVLINPKREEILLVENLDPEKKSGFYGLPGGRVEIDEPPAKAMEREWAEETGQKITTKSRPISIIRKGRDKSCDYTHFFFPIHAPQKKGMKKEATLNEVGPPIWFPLQDIVNRKIKIFHSHVEGIRLVLEKMAMKNKSMAFYAMALTSREYDEPIKQCKCITRCQVCNCK